MAKKVQKAKYPSVNVTNFGKMASESKIFLQWICLDAKNMPDSFRIIWEYIPKTLTINGSTSYTGSEAMEYVDSNVSETPEWLVGEDTNISFDAIDKISKTYYDDYSIPSNTEAIRVRVQPVGKKTNKGVYKWSGAWSDYLYYNNITTTVSAPTVTINVDNSNRLDLSISQLSGNATAIEFEVLRVDTTTQEQSTVGGELMASISGGVASTSLDVTAGGGYKARCRALKPVDPFWLYGTEAITDYQSSAIIRGEWSEYTSDFVYSDIASPEEITELYAKTSSSTYIAWSSITGASKYTISYIADDPDLFDKSSLAQTIDTTSNTPNYTLTDLELGHTYYFRVRAVKTISGSSEQTSLWSPIKSLALGELPSAPTTWSSSNVVNYGTNSIIYWIHNSTDGAEEKKAKLDLTINQNDNLQTATVTAINSSNMATQVKLSGAASSIDVNSILLPSNITYAVNDEVTVEKISVSNVDKANIHGKTIVITRTADSDDTSRYEFNTSSYTSGATLNYRVKTLGITFDENEEASYSIWSTTKEVDIYAPPVTTFTVSYSDGTALTNNTLTHFPFKVQASVSSQNQNAIGYSLSIVSNDDYDVEYYNQTNHVSIGDILMDKSYDGSGDLSVLIYPNDVSLETSHSYSIKCTVFLDSGLTATPNAYVFSTSWTIQEFRIGANITIDEDLYSASINPYCFELVKTGVVVLEDSVKKIVFDDATGHPSIGQTVKMPIYSSSIVSASDLAEGDWVSGKVVTVSSVNYASVMSIIPNEEVTDKWFNKVTLATLSLVNNIYTVTFEEPDISEVETLVIPSSQVLDISVEDGDEVVLWYKVENSVEKYYITGKMDNASSVLLNVYRKQFDGEIVPIFTNIPNNSTSYVTDPHPSLDYARYRITAVDTRTGNTIYTDIDDLEVNAPYAIFQWNGYTNSYTPTANTTGTPWSGSILKIPYNIDVSESNDLDVELIEYIGRSSPVSYYGTQIGQKTSWNMEIPKSDTETLSMLRQLSRYLGDVYVREPSGLGYWANISVSWSQTHMELTIPITVSITRVEGGI